VRQLRIISIALLAGLLQVSLLGALRVEGVVPNLVVVVVVCFTIWGSASEAMVTAIIAGLMMDVAGAGTFGLATSSLVLISLVSVMVRQLGVDGQILPIRIALVAGVSVLWSLLHVASIGLGAIALAATWRVMGLEIIINCLLVLLCTERIFRGPRTV